QVADPYFGGAGPARNAYTEFGVASCTGGRAVGAPCETSDPPVHLRFRHRFDVPGTSPSDPAQPGFPTP
ncbi:cholesterol oxidase, partial [Streptomyces sp. NPDC001130]